MRLTDPVIDYDYYVLQSIKWGGEMYYLHIYGREVIID